MQLDLEEVTELLGNDEMLLILMQIAVLTILPQLNGVPAVRLLETREADAGNSILLCGKKAVEGFRKAVCQHLHGRSGHMVTLSFESRLKIVLTGEGAILLIVRLDHLQHSVIDATRLDQALYEPGMLSLIHEKAVFKSSHSDILSQTMRTYKRWMVAYGGGISLPCLKPEALMPQFGREIWASVSIVHTGLIGITWVAEGDFTRDRRNDTPHWGDASVPTHRPLRPPRDWA